jgi:DNA-binding CsgD family transcriptional regulator
VLDYAAIGSVAVQRCEEPIMTFSARRSPFVGRTRELETVLACLEEARGGGGGIALVAGESGIGKTRLLAEVARQAEALGWTVLSGRAYETADMPPYLPVTEALQEYLLGRSADDVALALGRAASEVARLLPELRALLPDLPDNPDLPVLSASQERYRLFAGIAAALLGIARATESGLLLILDDLQWADSSTLALLRHVVGTLATAPLVVALAYRTTEPAITAPLHDLLADASRGGAVHLPLGGLDASETTALLTGLIGRPPAPPVVATVQAATAGHPFFVTEIARQAQADGRDLADPSLAGSALAVPDGVRHVLGRRLRQLGPTTQRVLQTATVLHDGFSVAELQGLSDLALPALLDALDDGLAAGILQEQAAGFSFAHALLRRAVYESVSLPRRQQLHLRAAEALEAAHRGAGDRHVAAIAGHYRLAGLFAPPDKALAYSRRMAESADAVFAWEEAATHWQLTGEALERGAEVTARDRCVILLDWATTEARVTQNELVARADRQGILPEHVICLRAADAARAADDAESLARAAMGYADPTVWGKRDRLSSDLLSEALTALGEGDSPLRARCLGLFGEVLVWAGEPPERSLQLTADALAMARRLDDPTTLAYVLSERHWALMQPAHQVERDAVAAELSRVSADGTDLELAIKGYRWQMANLLEQGAISAAAATLATANVVAERLHAPCYQGLVAVFHAMLIAHSADLPTFQALLEPDGMRTVSPFQMWLLALARLEGCPADAEPALRAIMTVVPGFPAYRAAYALLLVEAGRETEARAIFQELQRGGLENIPHTVLWLSGLTVLAELCNALHDETQAAVVYDLLRPYGQLLASGYYAVDPVAGVVGRFLGLLATTLGRWDAAERHYQDALSSNEAIGARIARAHTARHYAEMLLQRNARGDRARARLLLDDAIARYEQLGITHYADQARLLTAGGPAHAPSQPAYPDGLSLREVEVVRLVAEGKSNPEIAASLSISRDTVERHMTHIFSKTHTANRVEATRYAERHQLLAS